MCQDSTGKIMLMKIFFQDPPYVCRGNSEQRFCPVVMVNLQENYLGEVTGWGKRRY